MIDDRKLRTLFRLDADDHAEGPAKGSELITTNSDGEYNGVSPREFAKTVLQNCGEIRHKNTQVLDTMRGTGFLLDFDAFRSRSKNPVTTYYGSKSNIAKKVFGNTGLEHLGTISMNSQRN